MSLEDPHWFCLDWFRFLQNRLYKSDGRRCSPCERPAPYKFTHTIIHSAVLFLCGATQQT